MSDRGRPSKMKKFVEAFEKVIQENGMSVVVLTDDELRIKCNTYLDEADQVADRTFESWKAWELKSEEYSHFLRLYKKAMIIQKENLFTNLQTDAKSWQRYAWIIERKFDEWNLRQIGVNKNENINTNYEVDNADELKNILKDNNLL